MSKNLKHKVLQLLKKNETERFGSEAGLNMDEDDVEFSVQQVWRSRCAITGRRFGGHVILTLTRWNAEAAPTTGNLVLLMQNQAKLLAEQGQSAFDEDTISKIAGRLRWAEDALTVQEKHFEVNLSPQLLLLTPMDVLFSRYSASCIICIVAGYCIGRRLSLA